MGRKCGGFPSARGNSATSARGCSEAPAEARSPVREVELQDVRQQCPHHACSLAKGVGQALGVPSMSLMGGLLCSLQLCYVCGERGATVTCRQKGCKRSFHFPCSCKDGCVSQFFGQYRSFCQEHRPEQTVEAQQDGETSCLICLEPVEEKLSHHTLVCPVCTHTWFHQGCIQQQALGAGFFCFQCPQCKDRETFLWEMSSVGIRVPLRQPTWEAEGAFAELYERHRGCDASRCLCAQGREEAAEEGPWQLLLCSSCAAKGTQRCCSALRPTTATWECDDCAGLGTGKRRSWVPPGAPMPQPGPGTALLWLLRLGLVESLYCLGASALASPALGAWGHAADLPASPCSLQRTVGDSQLQHQQPSGSNAQLPGS
ncbi:PHD finger protein 7-like [Apteryx mantelli]|uniref:PHD finger protein 7-like n=1 Tax=Apteryx mantelli TaxID=2696672 RepID=A0ABM4DZ78_9AVES